MLPKNFVPSSIGDLKRLANSLKKSEGLPHHEALNRASQVATYENYAHARSHLKHRLRNARPAHQLFLTVYWENRKARGFGRETLEISLSRTFEEICSKPEMKIVRALGSFRRVAPDHLVADRVFDTQSFSRSLICQAARAIRFMEATGLKPAKKSDLLYPDGDRKNALPRCDHVSGWTDPSTGQCVVVDEPYMDAEVDEERRAWAQQHGWHLEAATWPGMYLPYSSSMFVATEASGGYAFEALMNTINRIPKPVTEEEWSGVSEKSHDVFVSPSASTPQDIRRAKAKETIFRMSSRTTVPISWRSERNRRKPKGVMPFEIHQELGRAIKSIIRADILDGTIGYGMNSVRSELEDWLFVEHDERKFNGMSFIDIYYSGALDDDDVFLKAASSGDGMMRILEMVRDQLKRHYPECAPLNRMLRKVEASIARLHKANG